MMAKKDVGYLLDGSGNPVRSGSGEYVRTGSYNHKAAMEASREKLAQDVQKKLKADKAKDDADFAAEEARSKTARAVAGAQTKKAPAKKAPIVTKEQLEKSGFTTLRDYLNHQRGLTRRDGKAPVMRTSPSTDKAPAKDKTPTERARAYTAKLAERERQAEREGSTVTRKAAGGKVRGYGMARGGKVAKIC